MTGQPDRSEKAVSVGLSLVVPFWNEETVAAEMLAELLDAITNLPVNDVEVVCVDDGSTDDTSTILAAAVAADGRVRVLTHRRRRGYGAALASGFDAARHSLVGYVDGDGQYDPTDLTVLLTALQPAGEASNIASVFGVRVARADPAARRLLGSIGTRFVSMLLGKRIADINAGMKLFDTNLVDLTGLRSSGGFISTELAGRAIDAGDITEMPVKHRPRTGGRQTGASIGVLAGLVVDAICQTPELVRRTRRR